MHRLKRRMYVFPVWLLIVIAMTEFSLGILLTYVIGVTKDNFRPVFPYISDAGVYAIESGFFVLVFAITTFLVVLIMYIRFKDAHIHLERRIYKIFNFIFLLIGVSGGFFFIGLAGFQYEVTRLSNILHHACAGLGIFLQFIYAFGQTIIGILLPPKRVWWKWVVFAFQSVLTSAVTVFGLYFLVAIYHPARLFYKENTVDNVISSEIAYDDTLVEYYNFGLRVDYSRAVAEWFIFAGLIIFYLTLVPDFNRLRVRLIITRPLDDIMSKLPTEDVKN